MKELLKSISNKRNIIIEEMEENGEFRRASYKPTSNCEESSSYGVVCVRCGKCGRKFMKVKKMKNDMDRFIVFCRVLLKIC